MTPEHTIEDPLKLIWSGTAYYTNKPDQESQELVSKEYAIKYAEKRVKEEKVKILQEVKGLIRKYEREPSASFTRHFIDDLKDLLPKE